jgi:hypothetical protein
MAMRTVPMLLLFWITSRTLSVPCVVGVADGDAGDRDATLPARR